MYFIFESFNQRVFLRFNVKLPFYCLKRAAKIEDLKGTDTRTEFWGRIIHRILEKHKNN